MTKKQIFHNISKINRIDTNDKKTFRQIAKQNLDCDKTHTKYRNTNLITYLKIILSHKKYKNILLFYPMPYEIDILPLLKIFKKHKNKKIFLPTITGLNFKMLPYRLPLVKNKYGILEPKFSYYYFQKIDFALIPCLGIDSSFRRIGMGKGMYDKKFKTLKTRPYKVFISQNITIAKSILTQGFDIDADEYINYNFTIKKGLKNVMDSNSKLSYFWHCSRLGRLSHMQKNSQSRF